MSLFNRRRRGENAVANTDRSADEQDWFIVPPEGFTIRFFIPGDRAKGIPSCWIEKSWIDE